MANNNVYEENDKLKAAYALNMCTVSVSQIVDYNDEYILEQEYNAILNNINLEQMPKDEALLNILVKLLNVITFFRIDKIKRSEIDKKYQRRMENAIWSAIPSIGVIAAGNPVAVGISLATQVGIGYMNYRREKANAVADKESSETELRITAIEQLNALRRELFTTAWRLADEYNFPDRYRLTERQISQYNEILMDTDEIRKYERLMSVQDKFEAYLPFWYFAGHSAKYISEDENNGLDLESRIYFKDQAKKHFEKYSKLNSFNILREDELTASFALEYADLLLLVEKPDLKRVSGLIDTAVEMAGNSNDVIEMCAVAYLKMSNYDKAAVLLKRLVNEQYNTVLNAQLLSSIYVSDYIRNKSINSKADYELLSSRIDDELLFPMPTNMSASEKDLEKNFIISQRDILREKYRSTISEFVFKYMIMYGKIIPVAEKNELGLGEEYYIDDDKMIGLRTEFLRKTFEDETKKENYCLLLKETGIPLKIIDFLNRMYASSCGLPFMDETTQEILAGDIENQIIKYRGVLAKIQTALVSGSFTFDHMCVLLKMDFNCFVGSFFEHLVEYMDQFIESREELQDFSLAEQYLIKFCEQENLTDPNELYYKSNSKSGTIPSVPELRFDYNLLGNKVVKAAKESSNANEMKNLIEESISEIILDNSKSELYMREDPKFDRYFNKNKQLVNNNELRAKSLAVLKDLSKKDQDLIFTVSGIVLVKGGSVKKLVSYGDVSWAAGKGDNLQIDGKYISDGVDTNNLYELCKKLKNKEKHIRNDKNTRRWKLPEIRIPIIGNHDEKM